MPNNTVKPPKRLSNKAAQTDKALKSVGSLISWDFKGASWTPSDLRAYAAVAKLSVTIKDIPVANGMHNAASIWKSRTATNNLLSAKKVHCDDHNGLYTFGILETEVDSNIKRAKGVQIDTVVYDVNSKSFLFSGATEHAKSLIKAINHRVNNYTGNEFRKWIIMPLLDEWMAIRLMGGGYFVSAKYSQQVEALARFCELCGLDLHVLSFAGDGRTQKGIAKKGKDTLVEKIGSIKQTLKEWKNRKRVRKDGTDGVAEELKNIQSYAELIKVSLSANIDDLQKTIAECNAELVAIVTNQPTKPLTSERVLNTWRNAMDEKYHDKGIDGYIIPFTDFPSLSLPNTAKNKFYWKDGQRLSNALSELGHKGRVMGKSLIIQPIK